MNFGKSFKNDLFWESRTSKKVHKGCKRINDVYDAYEVDTPMHFLLDLEMLI